MRWIVGVLSVLTAVLTVAAIVLVLNFRAAIERPIGVSVAPSASNQIMPVDFYWTDYHTKALNIFTVNTHTRAVLGDLENGPITRDELLDSNSHESNRLEVRKAIELFEDRGLIRAARPFPSLLELADDGRGIMNALRQIPDWLMDSAICVNWRYDKVDSEAEVPDVPPEFAERIRLLIEEMREPR